MLRNLKDLLGFKIRATDGNLGSVRDVYFDDQSWMIRYIIVDTGTWLAGRRVLIRPQAAQQPDWDQRELPVPLTKKQVEQSPPISADKPVSHQQELALHEYFSWQPYWTIEPITGRQSPYLAQQQRSLLEGQRGAASAGSAMAVGERGDPHLRSSQEVLGYSIQAADGALGHVTDFIIDDQTWAIQYMVIDTRNWWAGKKVLVAPEWIDQINWTAARVEVGLMRQQIKDGPTYDDLRPLTRADEERLYSHYDRPPYW